MGGWRGEHYLLIEHVHQMGKEEQRTKQREE